MSQVEEIATFLRQRYEDNLEAHRWIAWEEARDCARITWPQADESTWAEIAEAVFDRLFPEEDHTVECPQCGGNRFLVPGALCGHWSGLIPWPEDLTPEPCELCNGTGEVDEATAHAYEAEERKLWEEGS